MRESRKIIDRALYVRWESNKRAQLFVLVHLVAPIFLVRLIRSIQIRVEPRIVVQERSVSMGYIASHDNHRTWREGNHA